MNSRMILLAIVAIPGRGGSARFTCRRILRPRKVLTAEQVAAYDRMRGYGGGMEHMHHQDP